MYGFFLLNNISYSNPLQANLKGNNDIHHPTHTISFSVNKNLVGNVQLRLTALRAPGKCNIYNKKYYRVYINIDTADVRMFK